MPPERNGDHARDVNRDRLEAAHNATLQHGLRMRSRIVVFVENYIAAHGYSPSYEEIGHAVGLQARSAVWYELVQLRREGIVTWIPYKPRTLRVLDWAAD